MGHPHFLMNESKITTNFEKKHQLLIMKYITNTFYFTQATNIMENAAHE